jgi:pyrroloquinoline-quinone synthase
MRNAQLLEKIDAAIAEKNLLKHPFYQDWQMGKLSREELQLYAAQYYRHVEAFPKHLRVLAARTEGPIREIILENLAEEENPSRPHPKLWRDFAANLGVNEEDITCCPSLPGTQAVVEKFREIVGDRPVAEAVAALYAYEAQVPEIATTRWLILRCMKKRTRHTGKHGAGGWKNMPKATKRKFWPLRTRRWMRCGARWTRCTALTRN